MKMPDINTSLVQMYLISLSCIVEEYSTSRVTPQALRLCFISSRALLCWQLSACRKGQRPNSSEQGEECAETACHHLSQKDWPRPVWWADGFSSPCRVLSAASHRTAGSCTAIADRGWPAWDTSSINKLVQSDVYSWSLMGL